MIIDVSDSDDLFGSLPLDVEDSEAIGVLNGDCRCWCWWCCCLNLLRLFLFCSDIFNAVCKVASLRRSRSLCRCVDDSNNDGDADNNGDRLPPLLLALGGHGESLPLDVGGGHFNLVTVFIGSRLFRFDALFSGRRRASRSTLVRVCVCGEVVRVVGDVDADGAFLVGNAELAVTDGVDGFTSLDKSVGWSFFGSFFDGDLLACISAAVRGAK